MKNHNPFSATSVCEAVPVAFAGIDLSYLKLISNGDLQFEKEMMQSLSVEIDEKMQAARLAVSGADGHGVQAASHSLKNLYAMLGISELQACFKNLETFCLDNGYHPVIAQQFTSFESRWLAAREAVQTLIASL